MMSISVEALFEPVFEVQHHIEMCSGQEDPQMK